MNKIIAIIIIVNDNMITDYSFLWNKNTETNKD